MVWEFRYKDLTDLLNKWEKKKKRIEYLREFALTKKEKSLLEILKKRIEFLKNFLKLEDQAKEFLENLNAGSYRFYPGQVLYYVDPYYGKLRITLKIPDGKGKYYKDLLALYLIADKLLNFYQNNKNFQLPIRDSIIGELVKFLEKSKKNFNENFIIIRGDFKSYTLNIPRQKLLQTLKSDGVGQNILSLVDNFLKSGNNISSSLKPYPINEFFASQRGDEFKKDGDFKSVANIDGILPGTYLGTVLGHIFLLPFDNFMKNLATNKGFYSRFFDDFLLIVPKTDGRTIKYIKEQIKEFLSSYYGVKKEFLVPNIVKFEDITYAGNTLKFEFLGYLFLVNSDFVIRSVRYKTLKKFIFKYIHEYKLERNQNQKERIRYLISKSVYIHNWIFSFRFINDKKILDQLYINFILPTLYKELKALLNVKDKNTLKRIVSRVKVFYKPTVIHRRIINGKVNLKTKAFLEDLKKRIKDSLFIGGF